MTDWDEITETIRESVSAWQAGEALGLYVDRHGRCACPMHNGVNRNCKLDNGNRGFHCFRCNGGGDVIKLVQVVNGCGFKQAVEWLNSTFSLGLSLGRPVSKNAIQTAKKRRETARTVREMKDELRMMEFDLYAMSGQLVGDLQEDVKRYRPTDPEQEWDERFCAALRMMPEAKDLADEMTARVMKREQDTKKPHSG